MKERPILFSAPMVRAILEGRKTQTRRVVKGVVDPDAIEVLGDCGEAFMHSDACTSFCDYACGGVVLKCPYGKPGDRLWVRESVWKHVETGQYRHEDDASDASWKEAGWKKVPGIHMPRSMTRLTLDVVNVRVEMLQAISENDCYCEGISRMKSEAPNPRAAYRALWQSINGENSWKANPWVWVIRFKRVEREARERA